MIKIRRGDIVLADLEPIKGGEQGGIRPFLIIQNNIYNKHSPVTIVAAITSKEFSREFPTNIYIDKNESKLNKNSTILLNQLRTIDKQRIIRKIGEINETLIHRINLALKISLNLH
jgi:mRNA interferase MazF